MRKGLRFAPETTKVIFFDLEYYVPSEDRNRLSPGRMLFSPVMPGHKILGGTFQTYYPMQDKIGKRSQIWEWKHRSERGVLQATFDLFKHGWRSMNTKGQRGSLMLAGIGISHSDVPSLLARMTANTKIDHVDIYDVINGCRQIDLSVSTFCHFPFRHSYFAFPKTKTELYQKYLNGKKMASGKSVWDQYDAGNYQAIEDRCSEEVDDALAIYRSMFDLKKQQDASLRHLKKMEKERASQGEGIKDEH